MSPTENLFSSSQTIDQLSLTEAVSTMIDSNNQAVKAVKTSAYVIEKGVVEIHDRLKKSKFGRLIYVGAGTSGRIGVQDGVELYPTFGWPQERVDFLIAGGKDALLRPIENAEDQTTKLTEKLNKLKVNYFDVIIGLAASGNTPYTNKIIELSRELGALTIGISNNPSGSILKSSEIGICLDTQGEVVAGSTRLKAATSQKICLNTISTLVMVKFKRVKNGQMTHLIATNEKLRERKKRIFNNNN